MRFLSVLIITLLLFSCKDEEPSLPPESVQLVFPERNSECTTGVDITATTSEVEFIWQAANNTESYELIVTNLNNNNKQDITVTTTQAKLPIQRGTPYSWVVISKNSSVLESATSPTWSFYNAGFQSTYAPFPAEIVAPKMGASALIDNNNEVELRWTGADVDNDIEGYEIYVSSENPPETLLASPDAGTLSVQVSAMPNTIYYWRVISKDSEGNSSDSGVFEFRAL